MRLGLHFTPKAWKNGILSLLQVAEDFADSAEFKAAIAGKNSGGIVDFLYQNTIDRAPNSGDAPIILGCSIRAPT